MVMTDCICGVDIYTLIIIIHPKIVVLCQDACCNIYISFLWKTLESTGCADLCVQGRWYCSLFFHAIGADYPSNARISLQTSDLNDRKLDHLPFKLEVHVQRREPGSSAWVPTLISNIQYRSSLTWVVYSCTVGVVGNSYPSSCERSWHWNVSLSSRADLCCELLVWLWIAVLLKAYVTVGKSSQ